MSIPTIQNVFHIKIELSFFVQHRKQLLSILILLEGLITFMNFQFKPLIHRTHISSSREKNEAKRKSINFCFNFIFIVQPDSVRKVRRNTSLKGKVPADPTIFIIFLWKILPWTSKCPKDQFPGPHFIWLRLPRIPLYFIFPDQTFCPRPAPDLVRGIVTLLGIKGG